MANAILITIEAHQHSKTTFLWEDRSKASDLTFLRRIFVQSFVEHLDDSRITFDAVDEALDDAFWNTVESTFHPTDQIIQRMIHTIIIGEVAYAVTCDLLTLRTLPS